MKESVNSKAKDIEMVSEQPAKSKSRKTEPKDEKAHKNGEDVDDDDDDDDDIGDIDEYLDWRSKKAYK